MESDSFKQSSPFAVTTTDGKTIEEHFGNTSTGSRSVSVAHMIAPPGWSEPHQRAEFDEYTLMEKGKKMVEVNGEEVILTAGESILVQSGTRVRYSNPFEEPARYWSVCIPAFSIETVHRE